MARPPFLDAADLATALPYPAAVAALADAFATDPGTAPPRMRLQEDETTLLVMPAARRGRVGTKLVTLHPPNAAAGRPVVQGVYVLFAPDTGEVAALLDGAALTARRTAAVSALATDRLCRPDPEHLVVFGTGPQARAHIEALQQVRPSLRRVTVVSRSPARAAALGTPGSPEHVAEADVVCTCTDSPTPVFDGRHLPAEVHVVAVGAHTPDTREIDAATLRGARIAVEFRAAARREAGDLLLAAVDWDEVLELRDVVGLPAPPRGRTVFKSVGHAVEDLILATAAIGG